MSDPRLLNPIMVPPVVNKSSFSEIWPFSVNDDVQLPFNSGQDFTSRGELFGYPGNNYSYISAAEESTVTELTGGGRKRRTLTSQDESSKMLSSCTSVDRFKDLSKKKMKVCGSEGDNEDGWRPEGETSSGGGSKQTEEKSPPKDYIHVRARRGQATDRHSLAERARREKISERMKFLQDLIPGCNKIIGKALVLDEIINYIQSLQQQVEFLSMKLEVVNSDVSTGPKIGMFPSGDLNTLPIEVHGTLFDQPEADGARGSQPDWLHMGIDGNLDQSS